MDPLDQLLGDTAPLAALKARARQFLLATRNARRLPPVLLQGETGTGKNLVAKALHEASGRAARPFVHVQCNAIPDTLTESVLFGHERGAYTGADRARAGYFRTAHTGTILLDEIGTLSEAAQARLLQVIDEGLVPVIGLPAPVPIDVWVICATNIDLDEAVKQRKFRVDLLNRLTVTFTLPPLRQRRADILPLAEKFLAQTCADFGLPVKRLSPAAEARLERHPWPDNARGLRNLIENAVIFTPGPVIGTENLETIGLSAGDDARERYLAVLDQTRWNISRAAQTLGVSRKTLRARIARWELKPLPPGEQPRGDALAAPDPAHRARMADGERDTSSQLAAEELRSRDALGRLPTATEPREASWRRRWLGVLRVKLTSDDADDEIIVGRPYLDIALDKVQQFGGHVLDLWPGGLVAVFGVDTIEGSTERAGFAALAIQAGATRLRQESTGAMRWRLALHAMSGLVGSLGPVPSIDRDARRRAEAVVDALVSAGDENTIVASAEIVPFLRRRFNLGAPIDAGSPGQARPVLGPSLNPGGFGERPGAFVGRREELNALEARAVMAREGRGQLVGIVGDPGVGKSRLVWEFTHGGPDRGWLVLDTASVALGRPTPFFAVIELLREYFDVGRGEDRAAGRDTVARRLASLDEELLSALPALCALLDLPVDDAEWQTLEPPRRRRLMLAAVKRLIVRESARQPVLLIFEDVHWADAETQELLGEIVDGVPGAPILMLITYRPEYQHGWGGRSFYTQLRVEPLRGESADVLIEELLGTDPSVAPLRPLLTQWTDGNPFFIEEVIRTLSETGALSGQRGAYRLTRAVQGIVVPGTVEEVLASRIARLGRVPSEMLRAAAVVGRRVPHAVLTALAGHPADTLQNHLRALQSGEFLYQVGDDSEREYTFRHTLTQEVAYTSLGDQERRALHSKTVDAIAQVYAGREEEKINELAHHAFEGGVWERAAGYLRRAGRRAFARSANAEAVECFNRALVALSHLPDSGARQAEAIDLRCDLRSALWPLGDIEGMDRALAEAGELARALQDARRQGVVAAARCHYFFLTGRHAEAVSAGEEALRQAEATGDGALARDATLYIGIVHGAMGNYDSAVEVLQGTVDAYAAPGTRLSARERVVGRPTARTYIARYLAELGEFQRAAEHARAELQITDEPRVPWSLATCYFGMASVELRRGDFLAAIPHLEAALELCSTHHLHNWFPSIGASLGYAYASAGRPGDGLGLLERAVAEADRMRLSASVSMWLTYLADGYLRLGRIPDARSTAAAALERARALGEHGHEAWAMFLAASIAHAAGCPPLEVEKRFRDAAEAARALRMRPLLAQCHLGLSGAYADFNRPDEAAEERGLASRIRQEMGIAGDGPVIAG